LIYLSLAAHAEESRLRKEHGEGLVGKMELYEVEDSFRL